MGIFVIGKAVHSHYFNRPINSVLNINSAIGL